MSIKFYIIEKYYIIILEDLNIKMNVSRFAQKPKITKNCIEKIC